MLLNGSKVNRLSICFKISIMAIFCLYSDAHAYIDPGTGLLIWQLITSAALGALFYFRKFIKVLCGKLFSKRNK